MSSLKNTLRRFVRDSSAATMVEYAIMVALIAVICIGAVTLIGTNANTSFSKTASSLGS